MYLSDIINDVLLRLIFSVVAANFEYMCREDLFNQIDVALVYSDLESVNVMIH